MKTKGDESHLMLCRLTDGITQHLLEKIHGRGRTKFWHSRDEGYVDSTFMSALVVHVWTGVMLAVI